MSITAPLLKPTETLQSSSVSDDVIQSQIQVNDDMDDSVELVTTSNIDEIEEVNALDEVKVDMSKPGKGAVCNWLTTNMGGNNYTWTNSEHATMAILGNSQRYSDYVGDNASDLLTNYSGACWTPILLSAMASFASPEGFVETMGADALTALGTNTNASADASLLVTSQTKYVPEPSGLFSCCYSGTGNGDDVQKGDLVFFVKNDKADNKEAIHWMMATGNTAEDGSPEVINFWPPNSNEYELIQTIDKGNDKQYSGFGKVVEVETTSIDAMFKKSKDCDGNNQLKNAAVYFGTPKWAN